MLGTVKTFDSQTGCATIRCNSLDQEITLCVSDLPGSEQNLRVGDLLQFQCEPNQGRPQITSFLLISRAGRVSRSPPNVPLRTADPAPRPPSAQTADSTAASHSTACDHCGKHMTPRLVLFNGYPQRSFCPFCGNVHKDFTQATRPSATQALQSAGASAVFDGVFCLLVAGLIGM